MWEEIVDMVGCFMEEDVARGIVLKQALSGKSYWKIILMIK